MEKSHHILPTSLEKGRAVIKAFLKNTPHKPGVYRMLSEKGAVLYVGKAKDLKKRITSYTHINRLPVRLQRMVSLTNRLETVITDTEAEALLLEGNMIKSLKPKYNVLLRDDKSFPYVFIGKEHAFPQVMKFRGAQKRKGHYFGPFASNVAVNDVLLMLQKVFLLRSCADTVFEGRSRPCLLYQIKRCSAPCTAEISKVDYDKLVKDALRYLKGQSTDIQKILQKQMFEASDALDFERAAILRNRLQALTQVQARSQIKLRDHVPIDVIACFKEGLYACIQVFFYRQGQNYGNLPYFFRFEEDMDESEILHDFLVQFYEKHERPSRVYLSHDLDAKKVFAEAYGAHIETPKRGPKSDVISHALKNAVEALRRHKIEHEKNDAILTRVAELFDLEDPPSRIEVYDNSHIRGTHALGCMIVADETGFLKQAYRRFNIRSVKASDANAGDDYQMMREVMQRRFKGGKIAESDPMPDLMLIDGGKGQLSVVLEELHDMGLHDVRVVGVAKGADRNAGRETFYMDSGKTFNLPLKDETLYYLQRLRDEAHRYAITSHRNQRGNALKHSKVDDIPGIGPKRKKMLLAHFGSFKALEGASLKDIEAVDGVNKTLASQIFDFLRQK